MNVVNTTQADGVPSPGPRRRPAAAIAAALLTIGALAVPMLVSCSPGEATTASQARSTASTPPVAAVTTSPEPETFMCVEAVHNPHCSSYTADLLRRAPVPAINREVAEKLRERIDFVMPPGREGPCEYVDDTGDACEVEILPPTVAQVRAALRKAGHPKAVIRTARPDDPAPSGALILAVPTAEECILLFTDGTDSQSWIAGRLPGRTCLAS